MPLINTSSVLDFCARCLECAENSVRMDMYRKAGQLPGQNSTYAENQGMANKQIYFSKVQPCGFFGPLMAIGGVPGGPFFKASRTLLLLFLA